MEKQKKLYGKPLLKAIKIMEVGAATCCKSTASTCKNNNKTGLSKGQRTVTAS
ncbi:MAG: hypothetical protein V1871_04175 [Planctomycetota bacterium]